MLNWPLCGVFTCVLNCAGLIFFQVPGSDLAPGFGARLPFSISHWLKKVDQHKINVWIHGEFSELRAVYGPRAFSGIRKGRHQ